MADLPKRNAAELIESLRKRADSLTGETWELPATGLVSSIARRGAASGTRNISERPKGSRGAGFHSLRFRLPRQPSHRTRRPRREREVKVRRLRRPTIAPAS